MKRIFNLPDRPLILLKVLKGAPLSCLAAMHLRAIPVTSAWLTRATGYPPESISQALEILSDYNLVSRVQRGKWQLNKKITFESLRQLANFLSVPPPPKFIVPANNSDHQDDPNTRSASPLPSGRGWG